MDRQLNWGRYGAPVDNDNNPNTLSLGQYVYGAALYSSSGANEKNKESTGANRDFDRLGPTTDQIDLRNNDLSGLQGLNRSQSMTNAFRYLPDVYQALHGTRFEAPQNLGDYFVDTSILRPGTRRSAAEENPGQGQVVASAPGNVLPQTELQSVAAQFGEPGQISRTVFDRISSQLSTQAPNFNEQQIATVSADLTQKSLAAGFQNPALIGNEQGRVFAYDPNKPHAQPVFSDPQTLNPDSITQNAVAARERVQSQNNTITMESADPQRTLDAKTRGMG